MRDHILLSLAFIAGVWTGMTPARAADPQAAAAPAASILAAGRGVPYMFLQDGHKVTTNYSESSFRNRQARPLALASADFDEDGMPDLASGYAAADGTGIVTIHRGNVDALWPYGKAVRDGEPPAFLPDARVFHLPEAPDFLAAGDFDADGHWDLVAASQGGHALWLLRGDGHGGFAAPERIDLPGAVTAFASGEINRVDGLTDLAVGIGGTAGARVLVFESPAGALRGEPEVFPTAQPVTALAMMPLDGDSLNDLAVGTGNQLIAIHGRDRMLTNTKAVRDRVPAATINRQTLPFAVRALAPGRFTSAITDLAALGDDGKVHFLERADADYQAALRVKPATLVWHAGRRWRPALDARSMPKKPDSTDLILRDELALPSAPGMAARLVTSHTSITQTDDLIVTDGQSSQLHVLSRNAGTRAMHLATSLEAIGAPAAVLPMRLSRSAMRSLVVLHVGQIEPSVAVQTTPNIFTVTNTMDPGPNNVIDDPTTTSDPGSLRWALTNALNATGPSLINFKIPLTDPNYNPQTGTFTITPTPTTGCLTIPNTVCLLLPFAPAGCIIDGYTQTGASPNTLTGGDNAVLKIVLNGSLGDNLPVNGLELVNGDNTVRGLLINTLTGQTTGQTSGTLFVNGVGLFENGGHDIFEGNFTGTDSTGSKAVPVAVGIGGFGGPNLVGGTTPQARNLISGSSWVNFAPDFPADPNTDYFQGNYVGTDRTGTVSIFGPIAATAAPFKEGINMSGKSMTFGGTTAGAQNLISGNPGGGLYIAAGENSLFNPDANLVQGNLISTDLTGTLAVPNVLGIQVSAGNLNLIGGTTPAARNVMSGDLFDPIEVIGQATSTTIQGNYIGVDISGVKALGNTRYGIYHGTSDGIGVLGTLIGGNTVGAGNVIANSGQFGILGSGAIPQGSTISFTASILGNLVGTDATGIKAMPNTQGGIELIQGGSNYIIGGTDTAAGNVIAFNNGPGVQIDPAVSYTSQFPVGFNSVTGNTIFSNDGPGVWVHTGVDNTVSENSIYSNSGLGIDIDALGHQVNSNCQSDTNGANNLQNAPVLTGTTGGATLVSATATDPNGNTSEFSNCVPMSSSGNLLNLVGAFNGLPNTKYTIEFFQNAACDPSGYGPGQTFLNRITVTTGVNCSASASNSPDVTKADVSIALTSTSTPVQFGSTVAYVATVTNNGLATAANVSMSDTLPAGVIFSAASATQGTCGNTGNALACNLGTLASGATAVVTINAAVNAVGSIANTATVTSATADPNPANNTSTFTLSSSYSFVALSQPSPADGIAGSGAIPVTIYGLTFYPGITTVTANNTTLTYTLASATTGCEIEFISYTCQEMNVTLPATLTASPGTLTITVTNPSPGGNSASVNFPLYVSPGAVTHFGLSCLPSPTLTNTAYNLTVTALDANGNVVPGYRGTITLQDINFATFTPASPYQFTASDNGTHTFSTMFSRVNPDTLTVADAGTPSVMGVESIIVGPLLGAPASMQAGNNPDAIPIGFPFPQPVTVTIYDANFNTLAGISVTFMIAADSNGASGTFSNSSTTIQVTTDSNGVASATVGANSIAGSFTVKAAAGSLASQFTLTSTTNVPATMTIAPGFSQAQSGPIDTQFTQNTAVLVLDAQGNPVPEVPVVFSAPTSGPSIFLPVTTSVTADQNSPFPGVANLNPVGVANSTPGTYFVTATSGSASLPLLFTNTSPAATPGLLVAASGTPQMAVIHMPFAAPLAVQPYDSLNGRCISQVAITFSAPTSGPSATFSANTAISDPVTCTAQVTATANGIAGGPYTVTATTSKGLTTAFTLTNLTGETVLLATGGTPQSAETHQTFGFPLQATLQDGQGNPMACQLVNFSAPSSGASAVLSAVTATTDQTGVAQVNATANGTLGSYSVTAAFGSLNAPFLLTNVALAPIFLPVTGGTPQSTPVGTPFAIPLSVLANDSHTPPNPVSGVVVTFIPPTSGPGATLSSLTAVTNTQGVATVTATANQMAGSYYVGASAGGTPGLNNAFALTNTAGVPAHLTPAGTPQSTLLGTAFGEALQITVSDSVGNPLSGVAVSFTVPGSGATAALSAASTVTNSYGVAAVTATANHSLGTYSVMAKVGSLTANFSLTNSTFSPCDVNQDGVTDIHDVQQMINEALGKMPPNNDLSGNQRVNGADIQIVINAVLKLGCTL